MTAAHRDESPSWHPGDMSDEGTGTVLAALELDLKALQGDGLLAKNTLSVQEGLRVLARTIDSAAAELREKTAALKELRLALDEIAKSGGGKAAKKFKDKVRRAGG